MTFSVSHACSLVSAVATERTRSLPPSDWELSGWPDVRSVRRFLERTAASLHPGHAIIDSRRFWR